MGKITEVKKILNAPSDLSHSWFKITICTQNISYMQKTDRKLTVYNYANKNEANHVTLFCATDPGLWTLDRGPRWKWRRSSSRHEDQPRSKRRGRWRWASRWRCSTSLGSIWWWCKTCGKCWPPRTDAWPRHTQSVCLGQNGNIVNIHGRRKQV